MSKKLTPWFPADVKPVRKGVYIASLFRHEKWYRYWDGRSWSTGGPSVAGCLRNPTDDWVHAGLEWRGLAEQPK